MKNGKQNKRSSIQNTWTISLSMSYLTLQTLQNPFIHTKNMENSTNKIVQSQKYKGLCPMVTYTPQIICMSN